MECKYTRIILKVQKGAPMRQHHPDPAPLTRSTRGLSRRQEYSTECALTRWYPLRPGKFSANGCHAFEKKLKQLPPTAFLLNPDDNKCRLRHRKSL